MLNGRKSMSLTGNNHKEKLSLMGRGNFLNNDIKYIFIKNKNIREKRVHKLPKKYLDLKLDIIKNYIEPIMCKRYNDVSFDYHMINFKLKQMKSFLSEKNKEEIELFDNILKVIQNSIDIHLTFKDFEDKLNLSLNNTSNQIYMRTSRIILDTKFEIYNNLFGIPDKNENGKANYDIALLDRIDYLLKTLQEPTFKNISLQMKDYYNLFLPIHKREIQKLISSNTSK